MVSGTTKTYHCSNFFELPSNPCCPPLQSLVSQGLVKRFSGVEVDRRVRVAAAGSVRKRPSSDKLNTPKKFTHLPHKQNTKWPKKHSQAVSSKWLKTEQLEPAFKVGQRVNWIELRGSSGMGGGPLL